MKILLPFLGFLSWQINIADCSFVPMYVNSQPLLQRENKLPVIKIMLKTSLMAREENLPSIGVRPDTNRDIGFATVLLTLENHQEKNQKIIIQNIEIYSVADNQLQPFAFTSKQIELRPLENAMIDMHLTNKTGYLGQGRVKAVVTYQIDDQLDKVESESVNVERH
ncbi:hypothetical protein [Pseudanabaena yagii]|uniref:DUF2808 domain-containing protein n=1 Tax=Pseudanabaena yagii GIHE-NHR1 TaxID=2722753 RepID=A0ABX1LTX4_9CYAN|nr:hypothetical protein [Pseudanabaena yagii]NMF59612.1 hypothetical protein [Pseudanabaena yagii GIHE-NHR1]